MLTTPVIHARKKRYYVAIRLTVAAQDIPTTLPQLHPEIRAWLKNRDISPDGPPFFQYLLMRADDRLLVEVGFPVPFAVAGDERVIGGHFPAGEYATLTHTGDYRHLREAHMALDAWLEQMGRCDKEEIPGEGMAFAGRTEFYLTDECTVPDPAQWQTEVTFFLPAPHNRVARLLPITL
ncbi:MAG TPA: GyrI-like domain-containing protein [Puia sp.]|jgi:effector-binding domain-containing protein|nr:GyrI-like domain-containing protein [Puia sp.]